MGKYRFTTEQRFVIWEAYEGTCFWCREVLPFKDTTVDHVLPEHLLLKPEELKQAKNDLALDDSFEINSFSNWVPAHSSCNQKKSASLIKPSPTMAFAMLEMSRKAPVIERNLRKILADTEKERILAKVAVAFEKGSVTKSDLEILLKDLEPASLPSVKEKVLLFSPDWQVVRREGHLVFLSDGRRFGYTSDHPDRGLEFWCPTCGNEGPWNGVICMSCGHKSMPGD